MIDKDGDNTIKKRAFPAISLCPTGAHGGVKFLNLETKSVLIRDQFEKAVEIPKQYLEVLNSIGRYTKEEVMTMLGPFDPDALVDDDDEDESKVKTAHPTTNKTLEEEAELKEFRQFFEKGVFEGVMPEVQIDKTQIIPLKIITKGKFDTDGNIIAYKSRGVARGDRQDPTIYEKKGSPTCNRYSRWRL